MSQKILVVDEDLHFVKKMHRMMDKYGFEVWAMDQMNDAEELCRRQKPDLAIIDLLKNNSDSGLVLAYRLKKMYHDLPIIIISSVSASSGIYFNLESKSDKEWIKADCYIEKDISPEQLLKEVFKQLKI